MKVPKLHALIVAAVLSLIGTVAPVSATSVGAAAAPRSGSVPAALPEVTTAYEGRVDVLASDAAGLMWLYRGNGRGGWIAPPLQVGQGWQGMTAIVGLGDFSGDGKVDVLASDAAGLMWLYRGNGRGGWIAPPLQVGQGWQGMTAVLGVGDFDGGAAEPVNCAVIACVALTFDDGPSAYTERLLDTLISRGAPATFFVMGSQVANRPATVRRQQAAGFAVENHTYGHPQLTSLSYSAQLSEVQRADNALLAAGVDVSTLLRPPTDRGTPTRANSASPSSSGRSTLATGMGRRPPRSAPMWQPTRPQAPSSSCMIRTRPPWTPCQASSLTCARADSPS